MQHKISAALSVAAALGAIILTVLVATSHADEPTAASYPNNRANHHPVHESVFENQAVVTRLGNATAVSYWTSAPDGWHVVTTVDTAIPDSAGDEQHTTVRFSTTILPGQEQYVFIPMAAGQPAQVMRIRRQGDRIDIQRVADPSM